jgi:rod shape determining protein RodA
MAIITGGILIGTGQLARDQQARLTNFLSQDATPRTKAEADAQRQVTNAKAAIAGGGVTGEGYLDGAYTNGAYVPEQHTDFVFSAVGEQFGLLGCGGVLALYAFLIVRVLRVAQISRDHLGSLLCCGVAAALLWHVFQNVGMTMGIMPITGIPLPFISYGGSSTIAFFAMIGLVQNVYLRRL